jgi:hypothetical protein
MKVLTTQNVYTHTVMDLCVKHHDAEFNGHAQIQRGLHTGMCEACHAEQKGYITNVNKYIPLVKS